jgi:nemo like kinase
MSLAAVYHSYQPIVHPFLNTYTLPSLAPTNMPIQLRHYQNHSQIHYPMIKQLPVLPLSHISNLHGEVIPSVFAANTNFHCPNGSVFQGPLLLPITSHLQMPDIWLNKGNHLQLSSHVEKTLGYGAFGVVWAACDPRNGKQVALKRIPHVFNNVMAAKRAYRELFMLSSLKHINIITLVDFVLVDNFHNFADVCVLTEYMDTDLHKIIVSTQPLTQDHVKLFFYQILRGVKYLHSAGIVHRDLKPGNLLVNSNCLVKICDFGLARVEEPDCSYLTQEVITQYYRPPELLTGVTRYSYSVDMWSCGCIFAELLSRRILFQANTPIQQLERILEFLGTPLEKDMHRVPTEVRRCLLTLPVVNHCAADSITTCKEAKALLMSLLRWDPESRLTAEQALREPYVRSGRARFHYTICDCCPKVGNMADATNATSVTNVSDASQNFEGLEPVCSTPLQPGFDAGINTVYEGKVKLWTLMQEYFLRDSRAVRVRLNTLSMNYRAFLGSPVAFRSSLHQPGTLWR